MPQTHHIVPRSAGGTDEPENLITLCFPCHATKPSQGHLRLLLKRRPELLTDFIKAWVWEVATNLLGCAEAMNPRRFATRAIVDNLRGWHALLGEIIKEAERTADECGDYIVRDAEFVPVGGPSRGIEEVLKGVEYSWFGDQTQQYLDGEILGRTRPPE